MPELLTRRITLALFAGLLLSSCGYFSKTAQDQRAYDRYVRRNSGIHSQERIKMAKIKSKPQKIQAPPASEPKVTAETSDAPQAVPASDSQNE